MKMYKVCRGCGLNKAKEEYTPSKFKKGRCKDCVRKQKEKWIIENKEKIALYCRNYNQTHKEEIRERKRKHYQDNKEESKKRKYKIYKDNKESILEKANRYYEEHRSERIEYQINYIANKRETDPSFKFMFNVSAIIRYMLKSQGSSKQGKSCKTKLPFTSEELCAHLENLFTHPDSLGPNGEVWMTKENHGNYIKSKWNDKDPATWTWQIDHIKPHSDYPYDSMDHPNFLKVWNLSNLRPLSSKRNQEEGAQRTRHKPKKEVK